MLKGRRVIVSGGTSGIGAATAERLVVEGARVWILGRTDETVSRGLESMPGLAGGSACEISDENAVKAAVASAVGELDGLDGAFANAGIDGAGAGVLDVPADHFRRVLDVNVIGTFLFAREAAGHMRAGSAIVFNASVNGLRPERGFADYNASKAAVISLAQTMALEFAPRGIAVTAICPGYVPTAMTAPYVSDGEKVDELVKEIPAGRLGRAEEVGALVAFLMSPDAGYMGGAVVSIDGGRSV